MLGYFEVRPNARIEGNSRLWAPFQDAVAAWRAKPSPKRVLPITDRVSELTVAGILIKSLRSLSREYEPREPGTEGRMDSRLRLDVRQDG